MELLAIVPFLILFVGGSGIRMLKSERAVIPAWSSVFGGASAGFLMWGHRLSYQGFLLWDRLTELLGLLVLVGLALTLGLSMTLAKREAWSREATYRTTSHIVLSAAGLVLSVSSRNLLVIFAGVSLAWWSISALRKRDSGSWLKPVLGIHVITIPLALFGLVMVRLDCGALDLAAIDGMLSNGAGFIGSTGLVLFLVALLIQGIGPLVLGKNSEISNMLLILSQVSLFGVLLRITGWLAGSTELWGIVLAVSSVGAMLFGSAVAWRQKDMRRLLVTASVTHSGYLLLGVLIGGDAARSSVTAFLPGFVIASLGAYSAAASFSGPSGKGLGWSRPVRGLTLTLCAMSLAGMPPTVGFMGRFQLFDLAVGGGRLGLVMVALVSTAVGFYVYSRIPIALFMESPDSDPSPHPVGLGWNVVWMGTLVAIVAGGILPEAWLSLAGRVALEFF
jgi:NADH-quinone oxidoreductase subunit N